METAFNLRCGVLDVAEASVDWDPSYNNGDLFRWCG
jgi:hypothetical protein